MDGYLSELSDNLAPSKKYVEHANTILDKLSRTLQAKSKFSIDRIRPEGGAEKKTSLAYSVDYDVTAFINERSPPFRDVLDDFHDVMLLNSELQEQDMEINDFCLQLILEGVEFDLTAATNMTKTGSGSAWQIQHREMLKKIRESTDVKTAASDNSAGLSEASVHFIKTQTAFVHKVARLTKYWNSTIFYAKQISGRSLIFELLGVAAGKEEEINPSPSILRAFRLFLNSVKKLQKQKIAFYDFYEESEVPEDISGQIPKLLDPSNPYNNLLQSFPEVAYTVFGKCARETLARLEKVEVQLARDHGLPDFDMLFKPQPKFDDVRGKMNFPKLTNWIISTTDKPTCYQSNIEIRKGDLITNKRVLPAIKNNLSALLYISGLQSKAEGKDIKSLAQHKAENLIGDIADITKRETNPLPWSTGGACNTWNTHDSRDLTFEIPVGRDGNGSVLLSCNLERM